MNDEPNPIRVVIADEHPLSCPQLRALLETECGFHIVGEAADAQSAVALIRKLQPDILLIDFGLHQLGIIQECPALRIVVMLTAVKKAHVVEAFRLGAHAIILKTATSQILLKSIRGVMTGHYWLDTESLRVLVEALRDSSSQRDGINVSKEYGLTRREVDIMTMIASGRSNKEVGLQFSISERTVKHHLTNIFSKVGVSSRLQLALFAVHHHLTGSPASPLALQTLHSDGEA